MAIQSRIQCSLFQILFCIYFLLELPVSQATVFVDQAKVTGCKGAVAEIRCTTTTGTGFLLWRNGSGKSKRFDNTATVGAAGTLGSTTTLTLNSIEPVSNAVVYTSTATENNMIESTTIQCSDGDVPQNIDLDVESPSSPSWTHSACRFSQGNVKLSWNPPSVAPKCCDNYTLQLSTGSVNNISTTSVTVPINESITAIVHCVDGSGKTETKSKVMTVNPNTAIEGITIEPLNNGSCDGYITYRISWIANTSSEGVCTPPITMSTITCTTSSTHRSSSNTRSMNCTVPANETVTAAVTITNAAKVTTIQSASADVLARVYLGLCKRPSPEPVCDQLSSAGIAAIIMGLLLSIIIVFYIVIVIYIVLTRIGSQPKGTYKMNGHKVELEKS